MKTTIVILLLSCGLALADAPNGETVGTLPWNFSTEERPGSGKMDDGGIAPTAVLQPQLEKPSVPLNASGPSDYDQAIAMRISYSGKGGLQLKIRSLPDGSGDPPWLLQKITNNNFAVLGEVKYENASPGSRLEMFSSFTPVEQGDASAYPSFEQPSNKLEGSHDWREFRLPFDGTGMTKKLARVDLVLHLTGPGTVHFRNMRVVQYPDTPTPAAAMFSEGQKLMDLTSQNATGNVESVDGNATVVKTTSGGTLWSISYPPVTTSFAILGEVRCEGVGDSYLEVGRGWTPVNEPDRFSLLAVVRADQAQGPFGRLTGTSDWKPFWLPCGAVGIDPVLASAPLKLKVVTVQLHLNGKGAVFLRNVKLVQCPEGFPQSWTPPGTILPDPAVQYPSPPPGGASASITSRAFDWGAFSLGVLSTLLFIVFAILLSFFLKRLQRIRHERELRRIASQDS